MATDTKKPDQKADTKAGTPKTTQGTGAKQGDLLLGWILIGFILVALSYHWKYPNSFLALPSWSSSETSETRPEGNRSYDPNTKPASSTPVDPPTKLIGFDDEKPMETKPIPERSDLPDSCNHKSECNIKLDNSSWRKICKIGDPSNELFEVWPIGNQGEACVEERVYRTLSTTPIEKHVCLGKPTDMSRDVGGPVTCIALKAGTTDQVTIKVRANRLF